MGGKRLISFRAGDRSEYLAAYALSRIAFVNTFPRQEDFGVRFPMCFDEGRGATRIPRERVLRPGKV